MKIIIPMAGIGKRMRPHTLSIPKPLLPVAGKPMVQRLAEDIAAIAGGELEEIAFIIGDFGKEVEEKLLEIPRAIGTKGKIYHQHEALGTAHAVYCAEASLDGKIVVAFADTLFLSKFEFDQNLDGVIWVSKVEDPRLFGVVKTGKDNIINGFAEKPQQFVSDLAIIGIYYFNNGSLLRQEIKKLLDRDFKQNGEYQLTDVLENMMKNGVRFSAQTVDEWLDCGNKNATLFANRRMLETAPQQNLVSGSSKLINSVIHKPCYIGNNVTIENSTIGPFVSVGDHTHIEHSVISNSIIQTHSNIINASIENSMIGNYVEYRGNHNEVNLGDYTTLG